MTTAEVEAALANFTGKTIGRANPDHDSARSVYNAVIHKSPALRRCLGRMSIMESVGSKKPRPRRSFPDEFTAEMIELCQRRDRSVGQIARDFDLTETAVRELGQAGTVRRVRRHPSAPSACVSNR